MRKQFSYKNTKPWLVVAGVLAVAAGVFHLLAMKQGYPLHHNQWHHSESIIIIAFIAVIILLSGIAVFALIRSKKSNSLRFMDVFVQTFQSGWFYYILFILLMIVVSNIWCNMCNQVFGDSFSFKSSRWDDIIKSVLWAPVREEAQYRVLPYMIAAIPLAMLQTKRWRIALGCFFALMILCVQLQFGYAHLSVFNAIDAASVQDFYIEVKKHIWLQGVSGVIYAITFGVVLYIAAKEFHLKQQHPNKFKAVLLGLPLAYLASRAVHASYNLFWIISRTF